MLAGTDLTTIPEAPTENQRKRSPQHRTQEGLLVMINAKTQEGRQKKFKAYIDVDPAPLSKNSSGHRDVVGDFYAPGKSNKNDF